ncbi:MAG: UTP--glucose-1-phosphate uridylyltransferase GalU [Rickettsiales bacterium]|nr:UTP--glucose-1-phosphate uridylyltransferase GalU [Rickettsiales bacterium]
MNKIRKVIFPVGGLGTRFLPATKALPKEMLPVVNIPLIQFAFEEAQNAGIEQFIFITGRNKNAINNHFDHAYELNSILSEREKKLEISLTKDWLPDAGKIIFIRQQNPAGLGHAVLCAKDVIGNEPFAVILADELLYQKQGFLKSMIEAYNSHLGNFVGLFPVEKDKTKNYGIVSAKKSNDTILEINEMLEKPDPKDAPSNLAIIGRYILQPTIFEFLNKTAPNKNGEIQITDAMQAMLSSTKEKFYGMIFQGERFDCGNYLGLLEANIAYALKDLKFSSQVKNILKKQIAKCYESQS